MLSSYQKDKLVYSQNHVFWIVSYLPSVILRWIIDNDDTITHWAMCTHDKDIDENGQPKKAHTHLLLYFEDKIRASQVCWKFHTVEFKTISRYDLSSEWNYLIHDSNACRKQKKYQYPTTERLTDDEQYFLSRCVSKSDNLEFYDMFLDYFNKNISILDMVKKYGYKFIMQARNLDLLSERYREQLSSKKFVDMNTGEVSDSSDKLDNCSACQTDLYNEVF